MYKEMNNVNIKISNNLRFHVTQVRIAKTIKQMIAYAGDYGERETFTHYPKACELIRPLPKLAWHFFVKFRN